MTVTVTATVARNVESADEAKKWRKTLEFCVFLSRHAIDIVILVYYFQWRSCQGAREEEGERR